MATYKFSNNNQIQSFPVTNIFIDKYMPQANATFVKVYLYGLRQCFANNSEVENSQIAKVLNILESDVINAWKYWESVGIVKLLYQKEGVSHDFDVEFIDLSSMVQIQNKKESRIILESRPSYSPEEISIYIEQDEGIRYLYNTAQEKLGKMLSSTDINTLYSLYDWLRLPVEVIIMLLEYCASINKRNMRYIEKVAIAWADQGITTIEKAEQHLSQLEHQKSILYAVQKCLGIKDRPLTGTEESYIAEWTEKMKFDVDLIRMAYELTILNTGKLAFPYLNSILQSWHQRNIKTVEAAEAERNQYKQNSKEKYNKPAAPAKEIKKTNNKFMNFTQGKYNFEEIERVALEKRLNKFKESR